MAVTVSEAAYAGVFVVGRDASFCGRLQAQLAALRRRYALHVLPGAVGGAGAAARVRAERPGIVVLDMGLPDGAGFALARELCRGAGAPALILVLPSADAVDMADGLPAADRLVPPVRTERLAQALQAALAAGRSGAARSAGPAAAPRLAVLGRNGDSLVALDEVVYLRASDKYVTVRTRRAEFLTDEPLSGLLAAFPRDFLRIHRNAAVAFSAIAGARRVEPASIDGQDYPYWELLLHGVPDRLPVARRRWPSVRPWLSGAAPADPPARTGLQEDA